MLPELNEVTPLAYIVVIPANEIVIPTIPMLTVLTLSTPELGEGAGVMFERDSIGDMEGLLHAGGRTLLTGANLMLFRLLHSPCSTSVYTSCMDTKSGRWTARSALLPLFMGLVACFLVAQSRRLAGGV